MWGVMFMLGMALVSGFASVPGVRYSAVPQEVCPLLYPSPSQSFAFTGSEREALV